MADVDKNYFELKQHGTSDLPVELYEGDCSIYRDCYIHWHEETEILYVEDGRAEVSINGKNISGTKGDLIFIEKGAVHYIKSGSDSAVLKFRTLVFNLGFLCLSEENYCQTQLIAPMMSCNIRFKHIITKADKNYAAIVRAYLSLIDAFKSKSEHYQFRLISLFYSLFYEMLVGGHIHTREPESRKNQRAFKQCLAYIDRNYPDRITVADLAEQINFSESYFLHEFSKFMGESPMSYLNSVRLDKAKSMLVSSDKTIDDIAFDCGFQSTSYFIKQFKKKNGVTPLQFRKSNE